MSAKVLSRTALCLKQARSGLMSQRRIVAELRNAEANKQNESLDPTESKYSLLNENSLSRRVLNYFKLKTMKGSLETRSHGEQEFEAIKINFRNWIVFDEQREFVRNLITSLSKELNVDREQAKRYFFNLNSLTNLEMQNLFGRANVLERNFRVAKQYVSEDQLINNDFQMVKSFQRRHLYRSSILKLIGIEVPSTLNQLNFFMLINQTEETLKQLSLVKNDSNLVDQVLNQLNLIESEKQRAKLACGRTDGMTVLEILERLSAVYLQIRFNYNPTEQAYLRSYHYKFHLLDLLNLDRVLNFIDSLEVKREFVDSLKLKKNVDKYFQLQKNEIRHVFRLNSCDLTAIDEHLKANDLQFVWQYFFHHPQLFTDSSGLITKLDRLIDLGISKELLAKNIFLLNHNNVVKLEFFLAKFGHSIFDYPYLKTSFVKKYNAIVKKTGEIDDEKLKSYTFSQFMSENIGP